MSAAAGTASARGRVRSRRCAVQALYQWLLTGGSIKDVYNEFLKDRELGALDRDYFQRLTLGAGEQAQALDRELAGVVDRALQQLDPVEHAILLLGVFELKHCPEVPWRVVINEAVELAKLFGAEQAHKFINSNLDRLARTLRPQETAGAG